MCFWSVLSNGLIWFVWLVFLYSVVVLCMVDRFGECVVSKLCSSGFVCV